ncbi:hypothetical protein NDU88_000169 [Pleurodeles waltl]|uniref:G-protein coupled receptors family 3 profile domain-containing protein n=1 Tax=Pleurodeles waltl TaxID=8319 RepID=A0AAV7WKI9_PLEWA|nr:hypothetical protein NDU88_000169 [Pleurodeles waltl]
MDRMTERLDKQAERLDQSERCISEVEDGQSPMATGQARMGKELATLQAKVDDLEAISHRNNLRIVDMERCITCREDQWSNENKDACITRTIELLSYDDPFGVTLVSISIFFSVITAAVLVIFLKHRDSAIVRANNRDLSYILLVSLMLSFLCSMLFIGRPRKVTCLLRQVAFGIIFAVAVSSVLAKSITVVIAFNATKPGSSLRRWVGSRVSYSLILLCTLWEVIICTVWLIHWPPFPDIDTKSESGKMILLCNEGSVAAFYCVVGYVGLLALLSFLVAFKVRTLPDSFNEARNISFSMLVFCSVWVSFIPAYLSTKGSCRMMTYVCECTIMHGHICIMVLRQLLRDDLYMCKRHHAWAGMLYDANQLPHDGMYICMCHHAWQRMHYDAIAAAA